MADRTPDEEPFRLPSQVTMPLLTLITQQSLDEDYRHAADRRIAGLASPRRGRPWLTAAVVIAVFGVLVSTAAVQTSRNADVADAGRATLIERIENQRDRVSRQQDRIVRLRARDGALGRELTSLTESGEAFEARVGRLRVTTGFVAVEGEGVRATVDDAGTGDPRTNVRDNDLALLVNALWSAGAEAISVNGQRITAMSSIRTSGNAIEVNSVGIAPPYTVLAIGDAGSLQAKFFETSTGLAFEKVTRDYGMPFEMDNVDQLSLPAAPTRLLRLRSVQTGVEGEEQQPSPGEEPE
jgi:uncharacterized protein YlxW (UPF0749 family)